MCKILHMPKLRNNNHVLSKLKTIFNMIDCCILTGEKDFKNLANMIISTY